MTRYPDPPTGPRLPRGAAGRAERERQPSPSRLYRSRDNRVLFGVAAGVAEYLGVERWAVRLLLFVALLMFAPTMIVLYLIATIVIPKAPEQMYANADEQEFWRNVRVDPARSFSELRHRFREIEQRLQSMETYVTSPRFRLDSEIKDLGE